MKNPFIHLEWASDQQRQAFEYGPAPLCCSGGFNAGKTWALVVKAIWLSMTFPNNRGLIGRKVHKQLTGTTMKTFQKICPPALYDPACGGRWNEQQGILEFVNGSSVLWVHMDQSEIMGVLRGLEINWFFLDQAEEIPEEPVNILMKRLGRWDRVEIPERAMYEAGFTPESWVWRNPRTGAPQHPPYAMFACNPGSKSHWLYQRFHPNSPYHHLQQFPRTHRDGSPILDENGEPILDSYRDLGYRLLHFPSHSNRFATDENLAEMRRGSEQWQRQFYYGEWGYTEGQIHDVQPQSVLVTGIRSGVFLEGTDVDVHQVLNYIRHCCSVYVAFDHGESAYTCALWAGVDKEGNVIFFQEYYKKGGLVSEHRAAIHMLSEGWDVKKWVADPSIFYRATQKDGGRWTTADEYRDIKTLDPNTAIHWTKADNNELGTRNRINEHLRVDMRRKHLFTGERGAPRLYFLMKSDDFTTGIDYAYHQTCAQHRKAEGEERGEIVWGEERDPKIADHAYDPVRYLIADRPAAGMEKLERSGGGLTFNDVIKQIRKPSKLAFR